MKKRILSLALILALLAGLPMTVSAQEDAQGYFGNVTSNETPVDPALPIGRGPEETTAAVTRYTTSAAGVAFIESFEGKSVDEFGENALSACEDAVNNFITKNSLSLTQAQFDALVDLRFNCAGCFAGTYRFAKAIIDGGYTAAEFADTLVPWSHANGEVIPGLVRRRIRDAKLFLYGDYTGTDSPDTFYYAIFDANGGSADDDVCCFAAGAAYGKLPTATKSGAYFAGWFTEKTGGTHIYNSTTAGTNRTLYARWSSVAVDGDPNVSGSSTELPEDPLTLKTSDEGVAFIKAHEGFTKYAVWDVSQWSIGYGSRCNPDDYPDGITEEEADKLLREYLEEFEARVDAVLAKATVQHTQAQYDAIVSFTYNLGTQWMSESYNIYKYFLYGGYTELDFVNSIGSWLSKDTSVVDGLVQRRVDEANLYLNGDYTNRSKAYFRLYFDGNGGSSFVSYQYFKNGAALPALSVPSRPGYCFVGWFSDPDGGTQYKEGETTYVSKVSSTAYAHWEKDDGTRRTLTVIDGIGSGSYKAGESVTLRANPAPQGYHFSHWAILSGSPKLADAYSASTSFLMPDENVTVQAVFAETKILFTDVQPDDWFFSYVTVAAQHGLFTGTGDGTTFSPGAQMSRAMLVTVLYSMAGKPAAADGTPFRDVSENGWYAAPVRWAYANGIVSGTGDGLTFSPNMALTREQTALILMKYAQFCGYDTAERGDLSRFSDQAQISGYAKEAMAWAVGAGLLSGSSSGELMPRGGATRAQTATILVAFLRHYHLITD